MLILVRSSQKKEMTSIENESHRPDQAGCRVQPTKSSVVHPSEAEELRLRVHQRSLREQLERHHFLLDRLHTAGARLIQSLEQRNVYEAIAEIIANLVGSKEVAFFNCSPADGTFSLAWSSGVEASALQPLLCGAGMLGRTVHRGMSQFRERQPVADLLPCEKNLTACVILKSSSGMAGVLAIFGLLPQKSSLEWADYEVLRFLETYAAVAIQFHSLRGKQVTP